MPINACSINAFTINSLKCRRQAVIPVPTPLQGHKSHPYHTRTDPQEWEEQDFSQLEGPNIRFVITIGSEVHELTVDNMQNEITPFVMINNLNINTDEEIPTIQINNFNMRPKNGNDQI